MKVSSESVLPNVWCLPVIVVWVDYYLSKAQNNGHNGKKCSFTHVLNWVFAQAIIADCLNMRFLVSLCVKGGSDSILWI